MLLFFPFPEKVLSGAHTTPYFINKIRNNSHEYLLFKDNKDVLTYDSYAELFHVTNLSFYKEIIKLESDNIKRDTNKRSQWEIKYDIEVIVLILSQLISTRSKRGINEIGTVWKWLAGMES